MSFIETFRRLFGSRSSLRLPAALLLIDSSPGIRMSDLAKRLRASTAGTGPLVDTLMDLELVRQQILRHRGADRRTKPLFATAAGERAARQFSGYPVLRLLEWTFTADRKAGVASISILDALRAGPAAMSELSRLCFNSTGATTGVVDRLEEAGLVSRRTNPEDERIILAELTNKGRNLAEELSAILEPKAEKA